MLIALGILMIVGWLLLKLVWNVAAFGVHILLIVGVIAMIAHFVKARAGGAGPAA
jgi:hypothetical protein